MRDLEKSIPDKLYWLGVSLLATAWLLSPAGLQISFSQEVYSSAIAAPAEGVAPRPAVAVTAAKAVAASVAEQEDGVKSLGLDTGSESAKVVDAAPTVRELSVEPGTLPLLPEDRPAWVAAEPDYSTDVHRLVVGSLVGDSESDIDRMLDEPLMAAVHTYVAMRVLDRDETPADGLLSRLNEKYIRKNLIDDPQGYVAKLSTSGGAMYQKWVMVSITPAQRTQMRSWQRDAVQMERLVPIGLGLAGLLGLVSISHLVLQRSRQSFNPQAHGRRQVAEVVTPPVLPQVAQPAKRKSCCNKRLSIPITLGAVAASLMIVNIKESRQAVPEQSDIVRQSEIRVDPPISPVPPSVPLPHIQEIPVQPESPPTPDVDSLRPRRIEVKLESNGSRVSVRSITQ